MSRTLCRDAALADGRSDRQVGISVLVEDGVIRCIRRSAVGSGSAVAGLAGRLGDMIDPSRTR